MDSNLVQSDPNQASRRIPSKLLRTKFEGKVNEVRKKKVIGTRCHISTSTAQSVLCKSLKEFNKAKAIKDLHFESPSRPQFVADPIERNIFKKLGVFSKLQKLRINYGYSSEIKQSNFDNLVKEVKRITNLKEFHLRLPPSNQSGADHNLRILGKSLRRLAKLQKIALNFDQNYYITANGLDILTRCFRRLSSLKTLNLSLKHLGRLEQGALRSLSQHMKKYPALENFSLIFFRNFDVGDRELEDLNNGLKNLKSLKSVKLGFRACDTISDVGLGKLFEGLQKLERIWINFRGCDKISDAGLQSFGEKLKEFKALKKLTTKFRGCDKITDQGMGGLMKGIRAMSANGGCLEDMTLIFNGCRRLTLEGLWQIWYALQEIGSFKTVQLGLKNCKNFTENPINQKLEDLKKVNPALKLTLIGDNIQIYQGAHF